MQLKGNVIIVKITKALSKRGIVCIPKKLRDIAKIQPGTRVLTIAVEPGTVAIIAIDEKNPAVINYLKYLNELGKKAIKTATEK